MKKEHNNMDYKMELAICFLGDSNVCGLDNIHYVYNSLDYYCIATRRKIIRINNYIRYILQPNLNSRQRAQIEIIRKINIEDKDGYVYTCAIYYTYLLRIIQRRWRKKLELRRKIYNNPLFINYLKVRETTNSRMGSVRDTGIVGLFYGNLVVNI
jgi:hypothetical protein